MRITVEKLTDIELAKEFLETTVHDKEFKSSMKKLDRLYLSEHSPMYSQIFIIRMYDIYSYVSTHFRTHKKHFICEQVTTNRVDRGGDKDAGRYSLVDMMIMCNAKTLIDMSLKRLCNNADYNAKLAMSMIKEEVKKVDESLYRFMVPQCIYRCGLCQEFKCCGKIHTEKFKSDLMNYLNGFENNYLFGKILEEWKDYDRC